VTLSIPPLRTELLGCYSDQDFLAKLHCVRQAFEVSAVWKSHGEDVRGKEHTELCCRLWLLPPPRLWPGIPHTGPFVANGVTCPAHCSTLSTGFGDWPFTLFPSSFLRDFWKTRATNSSLGKLAGRW
jgi:hypothetical protein